jgi:lipoprotein NlpI
LASIRVANVRGTLTVLLMPRVNRYTVLMLLLGYLGRASTLAQVSALPPRSPADLLLDRASPLFISGHADEAIALASQAIELNTNHLRAWFMRGRFFQETDQPSKAIADFNEVVRLNPSNAPVQSQLGTEYFKLGEFQKSLECFDRFLAGMPKEAPGFWQRGIVAFEAGKYDVALKQFEQYRQLDTNDVEVAVWQFLCTAKLKGLERARLSLVRVETDPRVPMREIHRLFAGIGEPADMIRVASLDTSRPGDKVGVEKLNFQMFYAHLYVGLYYEAVGKLKEAADHIGQAAMVYRVKNFMGELARVHFDALRRRMGANSPTSSSAPVPPN